MRGWRVSYLALVPAGLSEDWESSFEFSHGQQMLGEHELQYQAVQVGKLKKFESGFNQAAGCRFIGLPDCAPLSDSFDGVIAFDSLAISLLPKVKAARKIAIIGDPAGKRLWYSTAWSKPILKLKACILGTAEGLFFRKLPADVLPAMFGSAHVSEWQVKLARPVIDLRPFLPNVDIVQSLSSSKKPLICFGGTLAGTASRLSIEILVDKVLPALRDHFGIDGFEVRLIGDCPPAVKDMLGGFTEVRILGRVESFENELAACDIFVLPMNYPVGVRTRICAALAAGNICIAHPSVLVNMPELKSCPAVRLASIPADYANCISSLPQGDKLLELKAAARRFFDTHYVAHVAAAKLLDRIAEE